MHPAPSVIAFTTLSGLGFGLLFWLGVDPTPPTGWVAFAFFAIAYVFAVGGLMASTLHLHHPERAWRAFSQWRTSWLSREGVVSVAALLVMALYGAALIFGGAHIAWLGWLGSLLSIGTVFTTSMIYTQLKTIPRWNTPLTPLVYLCLALTGGALLSGRVTTGLVLLAISGVVQLAYWRVGDAAFARRGTSLTTATGLGKMGTVRSLAHPHTSPNYLMREFVFVIARKHALKLRIISFALMILVPFVLLSLPFHHLTALVALFGHTVGVAVSRWLFFAEAEHTVGLYYGAHVQEPS